MKGVVGAASVVVVVAGLSAGSSLLIPLVLAIFLAVLSLPLVEWLRRHHLPRAIAVLLTVIVFLAALTGSAGLLAAAVRQLAAAAPTYTGEFRQMLANLFASLRAHDVDTTYLASAVDPARLLNWLLTALSGLVTLLSVGVLVVVVAAFILFETTGLLPPPTAAPPAGWRRQVVRAVHEMQIYLRVKTAVSLATGIAAGLWVAVIGVDMAMLWGLIAFLLNYIPNLGSVAAALPPMVFALVQFGPGSALLVLGGYLAINGVLAYWSNRT